MRAALDYAFCVKFNFLGKPVMGNFIRTVLMMFAFGAASSGAVAETKTLDVTVTYRERIALPPDARLDLRLMEASGTRQGTPLIASQVFAMTAVPKTVSLNYDAELIDTAGAYTITATIWSGNRQLFRTDPPHAVFGEKGAGPVDIVLKMPADDPAGEAVPNTITGVEWAVTEMFGMPWPNENPATLAIDADAKVSAFGGCNRLTGQAVLAYGSVRFPPNFAATMMACPAPLEENERRFIQALSQVVGYVRYGSGMVMTDAQGRGILHFVQRLE